MTRISVLLLLLLACKGQQEEVVNFSDVQTADGHILSNEGGLNWQPGEGWVELLADEASKNISSDQATVGGNYTSAIGNYPAHFLVTGHRNGVVAAVVTQYTHENMYGFDPVRLELTRGLVNYYRKIDAQNYQFRIDPAAHWNDGSPVTAVDFEATYKWNADPNNPDSLTVEKFAGFSLQTDSLYLFTLHFPEPIEGIPDLLDNNPMAYQYIVPASIALRMSLSEYMETYKQKPILGSGPYQVSTEESKKDDLLVLKRSSNWWQRIYPENKYVYNFEELRSKVVLEQDLQKAKFLAGEIDTYSPTTKEWFDEFEPKATLASRETSNTSAPLAMKQGLMFRELGYGNRTNTSVCGFSLNQLHEPTNDIRVRHALMYLFPFEDINREVLYNTRTRTRSIFYGTVYENPDNAHYDYDPNKANALLDEAGWDGRRTKEGYRSNAAGKVLRLNYPTTDINLDNQIYGLFFQAIRDAGFDLQIPSKQWAGIVEQLNSKDYQMVNFCWGGGTLFALHDVRLRSRHADKMGSLNGAGYKNPQVDALYDEIDATQDRDKIIAIAKKIDKIVTTDGLWILTYAAKFKSRGVYWNRFGQPMRVTYSGSQSPEAFWWHDAAKSQIVDAFIAGDKKQHLENQQLDLKINNWHVQQ